MFLQTIDAFWNNVCDHIIAESNTWHIVWINHAFYHKTASRCHCKVHEVSGLEVNQVRRYRMHPHELTLLNRYRLHQSASFWWLMCIFSHIPSTCSTAQCDHFALNFFESKPTLLIHEINQIIQSSDNKPVVSLVPVIPPACRIMNNSKMSSFGNILPPNPTLNDWHHRASADRPTVW